MRVDDFSQVEWLDPWRPESSGLERELVSEVSPRHPLFQIEAIAIARRDDNDDVLFFLPKYAPPLAVVHLTWRKQTETEWPFTCFYNSIADFVEHRLKPDHRQYSIEDQDA
ncbi:MAG: hypothetical protein ABI977_22680 [Acidobacteriota bacterium]